MPEQIRITFAVDENLKKLVDAGAKYWADGSVSDYMRGLIVLHYLLIGAPTGKADIPGWLLGIFPLQLLSELSKQATLYWEQHGKLNEGELFHTWKEGHKIIGESLAKLSAITKEEQPKQTGKGKVKR